MNFVGREMFGGRRVRGRVGGLALALLVAACGNTVAPKRAAEPRSGRPTKASLQVQDPEENSAERVIAPRDSTVHAGATDSEQGSLRSEGEGGTSREVTTVPSASAAGAASPKGRLFSSLVRGKGDPADREIALGDAALNREDPKLALTHYRQARRLIPKEPAPVVGIVIARLGLLGVPTEYAGAKGDARLKELLQLLGEAEKLGRDYGPLFLQRGRLLLILGDAAKAQLALERAAQLLPGEAEAHSGLAVAALAQGQVDSAVQGFGRAAELDPNDAARQTNLGTALMMQGDAQGAISAYRRAVTLDPTDARARGDLGTAMIATNNMRGALPHLLEAQRLAPERATFMNNLGYALQQQGDLAAAVEWFVKALQKDPGLGSAWINLGVARAKQGDRPAAEEAFRRALKLDPTDPRAKANLEELRELSPTLKSRAP